MNQTRLLAALIGFLFIAAWIGFNFGYAILCLLGAACFYYIARAAEEGFDVAQLQERLARHEDGPKASASEFSGARRRVE